MGLAIPHLFFQLHLGPERRTNLMEGIVLFIRGKGAI